MASSVVTPKQRKNPCCQGIPRRGEPDTQSGKRAGSDRHRDRRGPGIARPAARMTETIIGISASVAALHFLLLPTMLLVPQRRRAGAGAGIHREYSHVEP